MVTAHRIMPIQPKAPSLPLAEVKTLSAIGIAPALAAPGATKQHYDATP